MPHQRVPRLSSLVGTLSVGLALAAVLALVPGRPSTAYAQLGPGYPPTPMGPGFEPPDVAVVGAPGVASAWGELVIAGQTQVCQEAPGAEANWRGFYGPGFPTTYWGTPWGFPWYASYNLPPFGGFWGYYTGIGLTCLWRPR